MNSASSTSQLCLGAVKLGINIESTLLELPLKNDNAVRQPELYIAFYDTKQQNLPKRVSIFIGEHFR